MTEVVNRLLGMEFVNLKSKAHNVFVAVEPSGKVVCNRREAKMWEILRVEQCPSDPNAIILRSVHGKYVTVPGLKSVVCNEADPQNATPIYPIIAKDQSSNAIHFMTGNKKYLSAQRSGSVEWNRENAWGWETFIVTPRMGTRRFAIKNHNQQYFIKDRGAVKCSHTGIVVQVLFNISRDNGKATISFVVPDRRGAEEYLCVNPTTGNLAYGPVPVEFDYVRLELSIIALRAPNGKFVTSGPGGVLRASADAIGDNEIFAVQSIFF